VIAKLDRLARDVETTARLMNSGVDFVACDNQTATRLTIHILAAVAEDEARQISKRTKEALAIAKARGTKLGTNNLTREGTLRGAVASVAVREANKAEAYSFVVPIIAELRANDPSVSLRAIAKDLNGRGETTRSVAPRWRGPQGHHRGAVWTARALSKQ
jgi:DNA invertase Pin-like site-specific DNA recombinase